MIGVHNTDGVPLSWDKYNLLIWNLQKSLSMADTGIFTISHGKENIRIAGQLRTLKKTTTKKLAFKPKRYYRKQFGLISDDPHGECQGQNFKSIPLPKL